VTTLADYRAEAATALRRLGKLLGGMQVVANDGGQNVVVDGRPRGTTPLSSLVRVLPGRHVVTLKAGDRVVFQQEIDVQAGDTVRIVVEKEAPVPAEARVALVVPPPAAAAAGNSQRAAALDLQAGPRTQEARPLWKKWWVWAAVGTAVAVGITALILSNQPSSGDPCPSGYQCTKL
jgi:hypothetical protein